MIKRTRWTCLAIALILAVSSVPAAYTLKTAKWNTQQVPFYINPANLDAVSEAAVLAAVQFGAYAWTNQTNAAFAFTYAGATAATAAENNGRNEVFFRNASNGNAIATTYTWSSGTRTLDTDIVFWDGAFTFFTGTSGCSSGLYIEDIAAHEFGHALGLGHSTVSGATMFASASYCSADMRWLSEDDQQGVEALYPSGATMPNAAPVVTITAPSASTGIEGQAMTFSGSASDTEDGNVGGSLTWISNLEGHLGTGTTFQRALRAGSHTITAKVTDSAGVTTQSQKALSISAPIPPPSGGITLTATPYKVKGLQRTDLTWTGTSAAQVDIYRDGARLTSTLNTGRYSDGINRKGGGSYSYVVCEAGTSTCSTTVRVTF